MNLKEALILGVLSLATGAAANAQETSKPEAGQAEAAQVIKDLREKLGAHSECSKLGNGKFTIASFEDVPQSPEQLTLAQHDLKTLTLDGKRDYWLDNDADGNPNFALTVNPDNERSIAALLSSDFASNTEEAAESRQAFQEALKALDGCTVSSKHSIRTEEKQ